MAQQYPPNTMLPETRTASDAAAEAAMAKGINVLEPRRKYVEVGSSKSVNKKTGGNSGKTGRRYMSQVRGHGGGQISAEEKARRAEQSARSKENQKPKYIR
jgi:hypothetical protein